MDMIKALCRYYLCSISFLFSLSPFFIRKVSHARCAQTEIRDDRSSTQKRERVNLIGKNCISKWILPQLLWVPRSRWLGHTHTHCLLRGCHFFLLLLLASWESPFDNIFKKLNIYDQHIWVEDYHKKLLRLDISLFLSLLSLHLCWRMHKMKIFWLYAIEINWIVMGNKNFIDLSSEERKILFAKFPRVFSINYSAFSIHFGQTSLFD